MSWRPTGRIRADALDLAELVLRSVIKGDIVPGQQHKQILAAYANLNTRDEITREDIQRLFDHTEAEEEWNWRMSNKKNKDNPTSHYFKKWKKGPSSKAENREKWSFQANRYQVNEPVIPKVILSHSHKPGYGIYKTKDKSILKGRVEKKRGMINEVKLAPVINRSIQLDMTATKDPARPETMTSTPAGGESIISVSYSTPTCRKKLGFVPAQAGQGAQPSAAKSGASATVLTPPKQMSTFDLAPSFNQSSTFQTEAPGWVKTLGLEVEKMSGCSMHNLVKTLRALERSTGNLEVFNTEEPTTEMLQAAAEAQHKVDEQPIDCNLTGPVEEPPHVLEPEPEKYPREDQEQHEEEEEEEEEELEEEDPEEIYHSDSDGNSACPTDDYKVDSGGKVSTPHPVFATRTRYPSPTRSQSKGATPEVQPAPRSITESRAQAIRESCFSPNTTVERGPLDSSIISLYSAPPTDTSMDRLQLTVGNSRCHCYSYSLKKVPRETPEEEEPANETLRYNHID